MMKKLTLLVVTLLLVAGCGSIGSTGQTSSDALAVQQFFPTVTGYNTSPVNDIVNAFTTVTGGASLATGNILGSVAIAKLSSMIDCYRNVGAVDARVYTQVNVPPVVGAVAIVNQNRAAENFLSCAVGAAAQGAVRSSTPEPCIGSGSFVKDNNTFLYIYAASDPALCTSFDGHFAQYR